MRGAPLTPAIFALALLGTPGPARGQPAPPTEIPSTAAPSTAAPSTEGYDARVRQSFAAAEAFQGRLDGGWIVSARGRDLLALELSDKGDGQVEGAWRDLRAPATPAASGLIEPATVSGGAVAMRFGPDGRFFRLTLRSSRDGRWRGTLWCGDERFDVVLRPRP